MRILICLSLLAMSLPASAQEKKDNPNAPQYKLEYRMRETGDPGGKTERRYTMIVDSNGKGTFRIGSRVPYMTSAQAGATQFNYADIGVNIDSRLREVGDKIGLSADLEVSSVSPADKTLVAAGVLNPTIGSLRIGLNTLLEPGKSALVASVDDPVTKRKFDLEATATKVN